MNPVIIIPTFISGRRGKAPGASVINVYDHMTPLSQPGELPRCLESLQNVNHVGQILMPPLIEIIHVVMLCFVDVPMVDVLVHDKHALPVTLCQQRLGAGVVR